MNICISGFFTSMLRLLAEFKKWAMRKAGLTKSLIQVSGFLSEILILFFVYGFLSNVANAPYFIVLCFNTFFFNYKLKISGNFALSGLINVINPTFADFLSHFDDIHDISQSSTIITLLW